VLAQTRYILTRFGRVINVIDALDAALGSTKEILGYNLRSSM